MQITLTDEPYETLLSMVKVDPVNPQMAAVLQTSPLRPQHRRQLLWLMRFGLLGRSWSRHHRQGAS